MSGTNPGVGGQSISRPTTNGAGVMASQAAGGSAGSNMSQSNLNNIVSQLLLIDFPFSLRHVYLCLFRRSEHSGFLRARTQADPLGRNHWKHRQPSTSRALFGKIHGIVTRWEIRRMSRTVQLKSWWDDTGMEKNRPACSPVCPILTQAGRLI